MSYLPPPADTSGALYAVSSTWGTPKTTDHWNYLVSDTRSSVFQLCTPRAPRSTVSSLFLPRPICASQLSSYRQQTLIARTVLPPYFTICWKITPAFSALLSQMLEPRHPYSTRCRTTTNNRMTFLFTLDFSFSLRYFAAMYLHWFYKKLKKTSAESTTIWIVQTQLCKLRGPSDSFV